MKTYAEAEREDIRRYNRVYGYFDGGLADPPREELPEIARYKIEWPVGYWEEYERLRKTALDLSQALLVHMVMGQSGKYRVYAVMPIGNTIGVAGPMWGPETSDRLTAWKAFIEGFMPKTVTVSAGTVKLGSPNKNNDVMVDGAQVEKHLQTLAGYVPPVKVEHLDSPSKKLGDIKVTEPKKGRKGRK